jgi:hypothetical protein
MEWGCEKRDRDQRDNLITYSRSSLVYSLFSVSWSAYIYIIRSGVIYIYSEIYIYIYNKINSICISLSM